MRVTVESILDCPSELVWAEVQTSRLLREIIDPMFRFDPLPGLTFPVRWIEGSTVRANAYLFGFIPMGIHTLFFDRIDSRRREILTHETNGLVREWNHRITVRSAGRDQTILRDEIEIDAGALTCFVAFYASIFYRHRHRRWRGVAKRLVASVIG